MGTACAIITRNKRQLHNVEIVDWQEETGMLLVQLYSAGIKRFTLD